MIFEEPVMFHSSGVPLVGHFFRSSERARPRQPLVVCMGSWLTVKEQMASTYARRLAELGYAAFVFDFSGFGQSGGEPRQAELPARKIQDLFAAVEFASTLSFVDPERIACLGICASAQYTLAALARGLRVRSFASVAGWYHDPDSIAPFYGGAEGVALRLSRARAALQKQLAGELVLAPAYAEGNDRAGMHFRLDYYARPERGAVPQWRNQMAELSWLYWLLFDGLDAGAHVDTPTLFVHADGCAFPDHVKTLHARLGGPKRLVWTEGSQIDFYDQPPQVGAALEAAKAWFDETLRA
jgi:dienelactone hydrolase